jgi:Family of unknown function (DUF6529)
VATGTQTRSNSVVLLAVAAGAAVAVVLGVLGANPSGKSVHWFGFGSLVQMKVWLAVVVAVLGLSQLFTALWMYGRLGWRAPAHLGTVHRVLGLAAVLVSLPVAYGCLWSLGFQATDARVLVHSIVGCLFYGALVVKLIGLHARGAPGWLLPVAGGVLFSLLVLVILTSAAYWLIWEGIPQPD